jgi:hypothetical protein
MVLPVSHRISPVPRYSGYCLCNKFVSPTGLSPPMVTLSSAILLQIYSQLLQSYNPGNAVTSPVWAVPRSLATTQGITIVFFSCGYLDVSVLRVCFPITRDDTSSTYRVAPFGYLRIKGYLHLPEAFRSLSRPS